MQTEVIRRVSVKKPSAVLSSAIQSFLKKKVETGRLRANTPSISHDHINLHFPFSLPLMDKTATKARAEGGL